VSLFARFRDLVVRPDAEIPLDEVSLVIAHFATDDLDERRVLRQLDALAESCSTPSPQGIAHHLFCDEHFRGNRTEYYDPRNSYLDQVLERRLGIPLSLSVLAIEVARRVDVGLVGVGMPGHFLLRDASDADLFFDPFAGGVELDAAGCAARFRALHGEGARFHDRFLAPIGTSLIVARMLANLEAVFTQQGDLASLAWVRSLRTELPQATAEDHARFATTLAAMGRFGEAARALDVAAHRSTDGMGERYSGTAAGLRARLN